MRWLQDGGCDLEKIKDVLGHSDTRVTRRYTGAGRRVSGDVFRRRSDNPEKRGKYKKKASEKSGTLTACLSHIVTSGVMTGCLV